MNEDTQGRLRRLALELVDKGIIASAPALTYEATIEALLGWLTDHRELQAIDELDDMFMISWGSLQGAVYVGEIAFGETLAEALANAVLTIAGEEQ